MLCCFFKTGHYDHFTDRFRDFNDIWRHRTLKICTRSIWASSIVTLAPYLKLGEKLNTLSLNTGVTCAECTLVHQTQSHKKETISNLSYSDKIINKKSNFHHASLRLHPHSLSFLYPWIPSLSLSLSPFSLPSSSTHPLPALLLSVLLVCVWLFHNTSKTRSPSRGHIVNVADTVPSDYLQYGLNNRKQREMSSLVITLGLFSRPSCIVFMRWTRFEMKGWNAESLSCIRGGFLSRSSSLINPDTQIYRGQMLCRDLNWRWIKQQDKADVEVMTTSAQHFLENFT